MTLEETLTQLKALGDEKARAHNTKHGAGANQFGVKHGDIRMLAKKIRSDHELAMSLWETGNVDAQLLAVLLIKPKALSVEAVDRMVRSVSFVRVADWLSANVVRQHRQGIPSSGLDGRRRPLGGPRGVGRPSPRSGSTPW